ncbi:unnamed protein product [Nezara viridula]|uniref:Acyl-coenzyme A oxidase n=1 Tax=Nezara viridula TaxID=85310 RepID=A0A9P0HDH4_NEZVI|nr:unnamed protein product [Nezara viridula]
MFLPTIMGQGTIEQQAHWISKAWNCQILGTYAQTELGHGTFIRGLETTAHYDPKTEEFVLHSPTLTSYKWWPGGCIIIGEIGGKLGMNGTNNGYLGFEKVRIPREQMLMKNAKVLKDGTYVKSPSDKLTYGTMIFVRVALIKGVAAAYLSKAVTIATREPEPIILEYKTQQYKIFPHISSSLAMVFAAKWIWDMYNNVSSELEQGDLERLPELHALSCCLKAICTADSARAIDECRRACGGHGFMTCSSLPTNYGMVTAAETYEGENTVMLLQTARFLMKAWQKVIDHQPLAPTVKYLERHSERRLPWTNDLTSLVTAYEQVAMGLTKDVTELVNKDVASGHIQEDVWNRYSNRLVVAAEHSNVRSTDVPSLMNWQEKLLEEIRPNAVSLVDSFDIDDEILSSPLGAWDGNVYERLFEEAKRSPLNAKPVNDSFHKYLKPFLNSNL